ncbi:MAG: UDP-glucose 6-dehydrogenase [Candidatus Marinimicrobia bacterium CG1_02_48_14]|nr:MAG: UDP-glucose 6-dehydrogenase [Candidatus Marinimicrobia bacterium CG1_02_48_14]PIZ66600.1 MAG: UDP-glucose 6-dehydrogenase [Candidatus Marinimicrobia bacterium CG_4_10_14_0_2_um_filter_48_9]
MKKICVIGTGYVGLVSGAGLADFGNEVICCDIDAGKIDQLNNGIMPIYEPGLKELVDRNIKGKRLKFTADVPNAILNSDVIFTAVGTPMGQDGEADLTAVEAVAKTVAQNLNGYKVICTKSTVPVGTGERIKRIITTFKNNGNEFDVVSNPEFLREGSAVGDFLIPDRVVFGVENARAEKVMRDVYRSLFLIETPMVVTNIATAELIKYASNAFLAVKISFINEMSNLADAAGADVHVIAKAMGLDGRISAKFLHPGPGYGGSCFPKDTQALAKTADNFSVNLEVVKAAIRANANQRESVLARIKSILPDLSGKRVAVLGLAFKPNTDDVRDTPAEHIIKGLIQAGASVVGYDPIAAENFKRYYLPDLEVKDSVWEAVENADLTVILTEWNELRGLSLPMLKEKMKQPNVVDARNILNIDELKLLGFTYRNMGRSKI